MTLDLSDGKSVKLTCGHQKETVGIIDGRSEEGHFRVKMETDGIAHVSLLG